MFGALGFFGSIDDERNKPDMFGAEGFFGTGGGSPPASALTWDRTDVTFDRTDVTFDMTTL